MRKRKHDTEGVPGIQTQLPLTLFQRELMLMTIAYSLFSYPILTYFMWNVPFLGQVVFRKSTWTSQLRTYKATDMKRIRGSNLSSTSCSLQARSILSFHRISSRSGIQSSAFFTLSASQLLPQLYHTLEGEHLDFFLTTPLLSLFSVQTRDNH